jgi:hypothetical protein
VPSGGGELESIVIGGSGGVAMVAEKVEEVHHCLLGHLLGLQVHLKKNG